MSKSPKIRIQEKLEQRILHGLACEWELALEILSPNVHRLMQKPFFSLGNFTRKLGYWSAAKQAIYLSRNFVMNHSWDSVREVLLHEMAHQLAEQIAGDVSEPPHGQRFQKACRLLRANPKASGAYRPLRERIFERQMRPEDKIMMRIRKLLALAESQNRHEAEAAMAKAHALIAKYNVDLLRRSKNRQFSSVFVGSPALRHFREDYHLAGLLQDFYFVHGIWVSAYVLAKGKMGRVLEISGTRPNLKIACYVHDFVRNLVNTQWDAYNHRKGLNRYRKTDFAVGIIEGLRSKLGAQHGKDHHQNEPSALVKIQDPSLKHYLAYKYPRTSRIQRRASSQDDAVLNDGMRIGKKAVIYKGISEKNKSSRLLTSG